MTIDSIKTVAVLGAGTMGNGIAHVFARAGYRVLLRDVDKAALDRGLDTIGKNLDREVKKGKLTDSDKAAALARIQLVTDTVPLVGADFVVEAVPEQRDLKIRVLKEVDPILGPGVILASNTSSISITELAAQTRRPDRFIGMHFMNPVPVMVLVEVIRGLATSDATFGTTMSLCEKLGKNPVAVNDSPGFVSNRVLLPMINEAAFAVMEGVATPEAVDAVMKLGMNHPMGPLELADLVGLDVCVDILDVLHKGLGDPKYRACPLLRRYVAAGWLGRKSGRGFYQY
ncbi:MAG: 3-hydroxybutyryl-CoA dehydrogenase [Candidatus Acidiferrales bacterium]